MSWNLVWWNWVWCMMLNWVRLIWKKFRSSARWISKMSSTKLSLSWMSSLKHFSKNLNIHLSANSSWTGKVLVYQWSYHLLLTKQLPSLSTPNSCLENSCSVAITTSMMIGKKLCKRRLISSTWCKLRKATLVWTSIFLSTTEKYPKESSLFQTESVKYFSKTSN